MLEGLVTWVLNNYLGKYVENLNTAQLSIALLSGEVELENLPLKRDALRHLGLPVQIKAGFIGKIKLQVPVRQIKSAAWLVQIEQLYLVATPLPVHEWDHETEQLIAHEVKLSELDALEARWRFENDAKDATNYYASSYSSWLSYGTGFITDIIENLQLQIRDVHVRYEDDISVPCRGIAMGITMECLSAQSCNEQWLPGFSHWDSSAASFKLLEMQKLAIYWLDMNCADLLANSNMQQLATAMSTKNDTYFLQQHCILAPVSAQARIKRNRSEHPLRSDEPRLSCDMQLEEVPLLLADWQYDQLVKCIKGLEDVRRFRRYKHFRPSCSVQEDARAWWMYAVSCLHSGKQPAFCKPKATMQDVLERWRANRKYVEIYARILISPTIALLVDEKRVKDDVEWTREFEELRVLREIAMQSVPAQNRRQLWSSCASGTTTLMRWFPQWMGWYSNANNDNAEIGAEVQQVATDSADNNTVLRRDNVFAKFTFLLKSGTLSLCTKHAETNESLQMIELKFVNLSTSIVSKPRHASHSVELSLEGIYLLDKLTPKTLFQTLIGPPDANRASVLRARGPSPRIVNGGNEHRLVFHLMYETRPERNRLSVKSNSLDVVYQPIAIRWLVEFVCSPHQRRITQMRIEAMKTRTKRELIKNWQQIMDSRLSARKPWDLQLDISAPQIFFIEHFNDMNSAVAVIDFGRLQLHNTCDTVIDDVTATSPNGDEEEDEDMYMTPCSTPPASEESDLESEYTTFTQNAQRDQNCSNLNAQSLHLKIYDRYTVELTDMQVIVARVKDNLRHAHTRGTSTMHVLDRFNISLQIERRIIHTYDPSYPNLTLNANLPKLVAHVNESKIQAARKLLHIITATGLPSPFNANSHAAGDIEDIACFEDDGDDDEDTLSIEIISMEQSRLLMLQFTIDHLALEVQSRGRSVAELQVAGVKFGFTKRPSDISVTLSVHSLLLVDALQTFGPDFELLIASHKHVGMDSISGSLRDSEPTSPMSPGSPDRSRSGVVTSPVALTVALNGLATSPPPPPSACNQVLCVARSILDSEALIILNLTLVFGAEPVQLASIHCNNLDIIANQETIVELMGFIRRVFPDLKSQQRSNTMATHPVQITHASNESLDQVDGGEEADGTEEDAPKTVTTDITFDFHRLNVLLLRGVVKDGQVVGKKICTSTMCDARIQATVGKAVTIEGSLGGLQIHDLAQDGRLHQRIVSVGRDPVEEAVADTSHSLYLMANAETSEENTAFSFKIERSSHNDRLRKDEALVTIRMASLWYTHSPHFVHELQSCATEFKQYMANLARSIRAAATDMALGLVHARTEALAQSLSMKSGLSGSIYGSALSFSEFASPRKRRRSGSMDSYSGYSSVRETCPQTPYTPMDDGNFKIDIELDIILDSPVLVLPRAASSTQVFVAHLGKINVNNTRPYDDEYDARESYVEDYRIEIRDMNLYSLDTCSRRALGAYLRSEMLYACDSLAKPILHDTIIELSISREILCRDVNREESFNSFLFEDSVPDAKPCEIMQPTENIAVNGNVVTALKVSLTRWQYEQLLDTIGWMTASSATEAPAKNPLSNLTDITEEDTGVTTLKMDPQVRAKLFSNVRRINSGRQLKEFVAVKVIFDLPDFTIELRGDSPTGEQGLVDLSFRDFRFLYDHSHLYETNIKVSLRAIYMEDLLQPEGSKQRAMVVSSNDETPTGPNCISRSCPDIYTTTSSSPASHWCGSLPDHLEIESACRSHSIYQPAVVSLCPNTPPPSPSSSRPVKNLVLMSTLLVDANAPNFATQYKSLQRSTSVDFNCLDLVINVESWVVVIDFFNASTSGEASTSSKQSTQTQSQTTQRDDGIERTSITVRSLTVTFVKPDRDIGRANISNIELVILANNRRKEVEGKLGSMSLLDLTAHGNIHRERFMTCGKHALKFKYVRHGCDEIKEYDSQLTVDTSSVIYVHTKRFVVELQAFFNHFAQLQTVMAGIRAATSGQQVSDDAQRLSIILTADSPVIVLPLSSKSAQLIIVDMGHLKVTNEFKESGAVGTISVQSKLNNSKRKCLLDVMHLDLQNVNLQAGEAVLSSGSSLNMPYRLGNYSIRRTGDSLLTKKCHLKIQVERNLNANICHNVPDMSTHGELSTLDATLDLSQYRLIRGFLVHNLGENTEHILSSVQAPYITAEPNIREVWTLSSLRLDLLNVVVRLQHCNKKLQSIPLACINFIKSRLTVDAFSNMSQDIDLVSQEILIVDTRFSDLPIGQHSNVFTNILEPIKLSSGQHSNVVQVEIHSRKRHDRSKFTILLNNMRLMAVFDWWTLAKEFIFQDVEVEASPSPKRAPGKSQTAGAPFELKLNITESEVVVLENAASLDTNAVILKSTTVITYRSARIAEKPISCNLNNCEVYSCVFGKADETALSIIDPVTMNIEVSKDRVCDIQLPRLTVRLSYFDMMMFSQILNSLPKQLFATQSDNDEDESSAMIQKLVALGFVEDDCVIALKESNHKLDDAAIWLTQNAVPRSERDGDYDGIASVEFKADKIFFCIIDDCGDSDVPLIEVSLTSVFLKQDLTELLDHSGNGALECLLAGDYYNRVLSGWEPVVEPWRCLITWGRTIPLFMPSKQRLEVRVESKEVLNVNVTSTFIALYKQVRDSWTQDFYAPKSGKPRLPFIPYVIRNETGVPLFYNTIIAEMDDGCCYDAIRQSDVESNWKLVAPDEQAQFSFRSRDKIRHSDTHKMQMHQLAIQLDGYEQVAPVTIDKVGVYFRHVETIANKSKVYADAPMARIVFDVSLIGSAKKLVTIRSALQLINQLPDEVELKLDSKLPADSAVLWPASKTFRVPSGATLSVPIMHAHSSVCVRPVGVEQKFNYSQPAIEWEQVAKEGGHLYEIKKCHHLPRGGHVYRLCAQIRREKYPMERISQRLQPAHTITLLPCLLIHNLLPVDLFYSIANSNVGRIAPGRRITTASVDVESNVDVKFWLDNFPTASLLTIPSGTCNTCRLRLEDCFGRKLFVTAAVSLHTDDAKVKVVVTAPYWILNKTGLPLIFRQYGVSTEAAGQFNDHEAARMISPLLFSLSDPGASSCIEARVGHHVIANGAPQWCQSFHLQRGVQVRKLHVSLRDNRADVVFLVGVEVRKGRGKYRHASIVTITPRYQLHNRSSYQLQFAQSCFAQRQDEKNYIKAMPNGNMPFHWPRLDQELLLCVLIEDVRDCQWSGGLHIDANYSMHVNVRDINGHMYFLRLEVVQQGASYFVIFTDADTMPPPMRIDNFSEVTIKFAQSCCKDTLTSIARAHSIVPYAWDQPTMPLRLSIEAPGGVSHTYDISKIGKAPQLTYENFIYIAFSGTFRRPHGILESGVDVHNQQLVLDVDAHDPHHVVLARKEHGCRSQLWRMTLMGQLQHEGSSPPSHPSQPRSDNILVLDIEDTAPQPDMYTRLVLRRPDPRRKSTQTWRFTDDGRLCCAHRNMCVQAQDGFFGLRQGNSAVLGLPRRKCHQTTDNGIPLEQAVERQRLRPGSGRLDVEVSTDGPTRVLSVWDSKDRMQQQQQQEASDERNEWLSISVQPRRPILSSDDAKGISSEYQVTVVLHALGVSLVSKRPPQELLYAKFDKIIGEFVSTSKFKRLCISIGDVQMDNQLLESSTTNFLYITPTKSSGGGASDADMQSRLSALEVRVEMHPIVPNENAIIFEHLIVRVKKLTVHLEERLLLSLCEFVGITSSKDEDVHQSAENDCETQRIVTNVTAAHAKRYYFGIIQLVPDQLRLSMITASKLPPSLQAIKRKMGLTCINFEDAGIDLESYVRQHTFETVGGLAHSIAHHFRAELLWQTANILGSVDFLGNPMGFVNDVSEGVSGLIYEGNIGALVKNVTHGISNSAAKVTETISDGLGKVTMDEEHEELRLKIRQNVYGSIGGHLLAGVKGFSVGMLGGATGIFKQIYEGASNEGIPGVISGFGKGIVGAVTKPVVGVLDLASETARAVRDSSRGTNRLAPQQMRPARCVVGPGGLLPRFSAKQSIGQQYLYALNDRNYNEILVAYEILRSGSEDLRVIISSMRVCIVTSANSSSQLTTVIESSLSELDKCRIVQQPEHGEMRHYIEIIVRLNGMSNSFLAYQDAVRRPKVRCDSLQVAKLVTRQINYAKRLFDERKLTLTLSDNILTQIQD